MSVVLRLRALDSFGNELFNEKIYNIRYKHKHKQTSHSRSHIHTHHTIAYIRSLELCIFDRWKRFRSILLFQYDFFYFFFHFSRPNFNKTQITSSVYCSKFRCWLYMTELTVFLHKYELKNVTIITYNFTKISNVILYFA